LIIQRQALSPLGVRYLRSFRAASRLAERRFDAHPERIDSQGVRLIFRRLVTRLRGKIRNYCHSIYFQLVTKLRRCANHVASGLPTSPCERSTLTENCERYASLQPTLPHAMRKTMTLHQHYRTISLFLHRN
jgi:hypothetical protein